MAPETTCRFSHTAHSAHSIVQSAYMDGLTAGAMNILYPIISTFASCDDAHDPSRDGSGKTCHFAQPSRLDLVSLVVCERLACPTCLRLWTWLVPIGWKKLMK